MQVEQVFIEQGQKFIVYKKDGELVLFNLSKTLSDIMCKKINCKDDDKKKSYEMAYENLKKYSEKFDWKEKLH